MNSLDIFVLAVIGICVVVGYFRGFVKTCFSFVPSVVSLLLTNKIYPVFSKFLRTTPVYGYIENGVAKALNLESMTSAVSAQSNDYINSLSIPDFLKESLISNNNPVVYGILDATGINEYISGYVANMILNILSMIVVAVGLIVIFKLVLILLDVVTKLPVIHGINSVGEMCIRDRYCILSSLSGIPVNQQIAVTGSVNQFGDIQAIGGVNEKIEAFFDICSRRGLTGSQGVMIPETNTGDLMLNDDVANAVKEGKFHIFTVSSIDDGIEIMLSAPAGKLGDDGSYPPESVHGKVYAKLKEYYLKSFDEPEENDGEADEKHSDEN